MILEALAIGGTFVQAWRASDLDNKAFNTLRRAYDTHADAVVLFERKKEAADISLKKLVNRKKAIYTTRMQEFLELYGRIHTIHFRPGKGIQELFSCTFSTEDAKELQQLAITSMKPLSEKESALRFIFLGVGNSMLADSKRAVQIANTQVRIANAMYAHAETMSIMVEAIGQRAEQFSTLLAELNKQFGAYLNTAREIIDRNGNDGDKYSENELAILTDCMNFADAIKRYLDIPILSQDGSVTEVSLKALEDGKRTLRQFQRQV